MSTLKVNKIRDNSGSTDAIVLDPSGGAVLAGVTTVSTVKVGSGVTISSDGDVFTTGITTSSSVIVGSGVTISESGIEASGIGITVANINSGAVSGPRNLIINGAMNVTQYQDKIGDNTNDGYAVDRMRTEVNSVDNDVTSSSGTVASGTTPYSLGFRKTWKVVNGNQTSGAQGTSRIALQYRIEAQDIAHSGWDYTSPTSFITLQFWCKSSVAQNFYGVLMSNDGTQQNYPFETGSLTADTWTKVVKTIPGNANLTFNEDTGEGIKIEIHMLRGTDYTDSSVSLNQWAAYATGTRTPDQTTTWFTTNDATFEVTGLQLEVGSQATSFEHRLFADELAQCQRYFVMFGGNVTAWRLGFMWVNTSTNAYCDVHLPVTMRNIPSQIYTNGTAAEYQVHGASSASAGGNQIVNSSSLPTIHTQSTKNLVQLSFTTAGSLVVGRNAWFRSAASTVYIGIGAEIA